MVMHDHPSQKSQDMLETTIEATAEKGCRDPDPRKIVLQVFSKFVESRVAQDEELIIVIDANNKDKINSDFIKFYTSNNLIG
eukprot:8983137-Ditylum_brightwellii.AAC.1